MRTSVGLQVGRVIFEGGGDCSDCLFCAVQVPEAIGEYGVAAGMSGIKLEKLFGELASVIPLCGLVGDVEESGEGGFV